LIVEFKAKITHFCPKSYPSAAAADRSARGTEIRAPSVAEGRFYKMILFINAIRYNQKIL